MITKGFYIIYLGQIYINPSLKEIHQVYALLDLPFI